MVSARKRFQVWLMTILLGCAAASTGVNAQIPPELRSSTRVLQPCRDVQPVGADRGSADRSGRQFLGTGNLPAVEPCDDRGVEENPTFVNKEDDPPAVAHQIEPFAAPADLGSRLQVRPSIRASGQEAELIASASAEVLAILQNHNACSAWFAKTDPDVARTFSSLQFWIERDGPEHIVQERGENGYWIRHGPYIARTSENTGAGTNVAINASGAFFRSKAEVFKIEWQQGLELPTNTWQNLHIGPYDGATGKAQVITLLHELAHIVGAIPSDGMSPSGLNRSEQNTEVILRHCKGAVDSTAKHTVIELAQNLTK